MARNRFRDPWERGTGITPDPMPRYRAGGAHKQCPPGTSWNPVHGFCQGTNPMPPPPSNPWTRRRGGKARRFHAGGTTGTHLHPHAHRFGNPGTDQYMMHVDTHDTAYTNFRNSPYRSRGAWTRMAGSAEHGAHTHNIGNQPHNIWQDVGNRKITGTSHQVTSHMPGYGGMSQHSHRVGYQGQGFVGGGMEGEPTGPLPSGHYPAFKNLDAYAVYTGEAINTRNPYTPQHGGRRRSTKPISLGRRYASGGLINDPVCDGPSTGIDQYGNNIC